MTDGDDVVMVVIIGRAPFYHDYSPNVTREKNRRPRDRKKSPITIGREAPNKNLGRLTSVIRFSLCENRAKYKPLCGLLSGTVLRAVLVWRGASKSLTRSGNIHQIAKRSVYKHPSLGGVTLRELCSKVKFENLGRGASKIRIYKTTSRLVYLTTRSVALVCDAKRQNLGHKASDSISREIKKKNPIASRSE